MVKDGRSAYNPLFTNLFGCGWSVIIVLRLSSMSTKDGTRPSIRVD